MTRAKIIDFGIARSTQIGDKTIIGSGFAGKDNYVSPEQVGLFGGEVTAKSDIYSLGLLLFYALTGQKLDMGGSQFQLVEKRRRVPDLGGVDMRIRPLLEQMLQPDPESRPATMAEIANWRNASAASPRRLRSAGARRVPRAPAGHATRRRRPTTPLALVDPSLPSFWRRWRGGGLRILYIGLVGAACCQLAAPAAVWPEGRRRRGAGVESLVRCSPAAGARHRCRPAMRRAAPIAFAATSSNIMAATASSSFPLRFSSNAAVIEGFGASTAPFDAFDKAFKRDMGFEASIGVRLVTQAQCPADQVPRPVRRQSDASPAHQPQLR